MVVVAIGDVSVCDLVEDVLKGYDLDVLKAYDGVEALKVIEKAAPHVAILDVALPRISLKRYTL
jgi:DNA-binding response OmpR family regulator